MENFKSFGQKLEVPFFPGFTAITGPNGAGKSNIVDAILFVLGPKSSKVMRAGRLTDLIFNGGKKQKNPSKYCKVSLVFDNTQRKMAVNADEVTLTRVIKRAPLKDNPDNYYSYYYINDHAATYTEFIDLLTHARISGEGYNIVKQGDVTSLVEMGSVDRRKIIDEIAGISTFDEDIAKAEKEREDVDKNLERIDIILNEIGTQIRQLKKDRDAAYQYKELKDKLYETKAMIAAKKKQEIEAQITEVNKQITTYETEQKKFDATKQKLQDDHTKVLDELREIEEKIADAGGDEAGELKTKIDTLRADQIKIEERLNYTADEIAERKKELKDLDTAFEQVAADLEDLTEYQTELTTKTTDAETARKTTDDKLTSLRNEIAQSDDLSMDLTRDLVKMREEYTEKQTQIHELQLKKDRLKQSRETLDHQIAELQETKSTYEFELKDIDWQAQEQSKGKQESTKKLKDLEAQLLKKKKHESALQEQLTDLEQAITKLQREQARLQAERDAAQTVQSRYNQAVNAILTARDAKELQGIRGTIAELAHVQDEFKLALEIAAGPRMQAIIVTDDTAAADAIDYLRKKKLGRATFLPLNKMIVGKPRAQALMAVKDEHAHGFAVDLVKYNPDYKGAFWYVFGDTIIVDTLTDARRLMGGVRLVDMKGDLIEASGAMIGGSPPNEKISFGTQDQHALDDLAHKLQTAITHQEELHQELATVRKDLTDLEGPLREARTQGDTETQLKNLDVRKKEYQGKLDVLTKDLHTRLKEKDALATEDTQLTNALSTLQQRLTELDASKEEKGKRLLKNTKKEIAQELRSLEQTLAKHQETLLTLKSETDTLQKKKELLDTRHKELTDKQTSLTQTITQLKTTQDELKAAKTKAADGLKTLMIVEQKMAGATKELASKRDSLYRKSVSLENELDNLTTKTESYADLIARSQYRLPTLESAIKELDSEIALYHVELTTQKFPALETMKESLLTIEQKMQALEPVNMRALEEYEHQAERKKKFDDDIKRLNDQKKNLVNLVGEVTTKKKERFFEIFNEVNHNFKDIYAQLSEGGEAELILENEESIFDGGLTIKARPRGKKILRLAALSGGEKSIASLGFIFAIQQYDPSPFYVLDEIDMFLDGVNAEIVSRMIKKRAADSQFISVSLRKIALKEADYLYGVTMHDNGISEMIGNIDPESVGPKGEITVHQEVETLGS